MVQSPGSTMLLAALRINVCVSVLFWPGFIQTPNVSCQAALQRKKTSILSIFVAGYIIIKSHFRMTSGLCNWPPQHEVDLLFTFFAARLLQCWVFFSSQQPLQSTQNTLHTQSESNASQSMPDLVCFWYLEEEGGEGEQALSSWWSWWVFVLPLSLQMQTVRRLQDVWAGQTKKEDFFYYGARPNLCVC